ncbi:MAG TPA: hypothetical protein VH598_15495, partial [Verrucomicrobiae bacterium]|nr:hypothetical protein [Verrucomicrobiae bacterium]
LLRRCFRYGFVLMNRRTVTQILIFSVLYYLVFLLLNGLIFLLSHVPPKAANLDGLILKFYTVERLLAAPRGFLRALWPWESTPPGFNVLLTILTCLLCGAGLAGLKTLWLKARK